MTIYNVHALLIKLCILVFSYLANKKKSHKIKAIDCGLQLYKSSMMESVYQTAEIEPIKLQYKNLKMSSN